MEPQMNTNNNRFGRTKAENDADNATESMKAGAENMARDASDMADNAKRNAGEFADSVSSKLKTVGVDTDVMVSAAKDQVTGFQRMVEEELQTHPMRSLGIAAAVGLFFGMMSR
jgi:ElaB/YqjD/DUF883 family membrane-anchored ribosome-binding protein